MAKLPDEAEIKNNPTLAVADSIRIRGGFVTVVDHAARNALDHDVRRQGMEVRTNDDGKKWILKASPWLDDDTDWARAPGGGAGGSGDTGAYVRQGAQGSLRGVVTPKGGWAAAVDQPGAGGPIARLNGYAFTATIDLVGQSLKLLLLDPLGTTVEVAYELLLAEDTEVRDIVAYEAPRVSDNDSIGVAVLTDEGFHVFVFHLLPTPGGVAVSAATITSLPSGANARCAMRDDTPSKTLWFVTSEDTLLHSLILGSTIFVASTPTDLPSPPTVIAYAPTLGMLVATATGLYRIPLEGVAALPSILLANVSDISDLKFDGERLLVVRPGVLEAYDAVTGEVIFSQTGEFEIVAGSRIILTTQGYFMVTGEYPTGGVGFYDEGGRCFSRTEAVVGDLTDPRSLGAQVLPSGHLVMSRTGTIEATLDAQADALLFNHLVAGFGLETYPWNDGVSYLSSIPFSAFPWTATGSYRKRIRAVRALVKVVTSLATGTAFDLRFTIGVGAGTPFVTLPFTETGVGEFYLEDTSLSQVVETTEALGVSFIKNGGGIQAVDWTIHYAASWEVIYSYGDTSHVTSLPQTFSGFTKAVPGFTAEAGTVTNFKIVLTVNTHLNGTDDFEVRFRINGGVLVSSTLFQESVGTLTVTAPASLGVLFTSTDTVELEIENLTNPGSTVDWDLVSEEVFWAATDLGIGVQSPEVFTGDERTIDEIVLRYKPLVVSPAVNFLVRFYKNGVLHHTYTIFEFDEQREESYTPSPTLVMTDGDTFHFVIRSVDLYEPWLFTWDATDGAETRFGYSLNTNTPAYDQYQVLTSKTPQIAPEALGSFDRLQLLSTGTGFLFKADTGAVQAHYITGVADVDADTTIDNVLITTARVDTTGGPVEITLGDDLPVGHRILVVDVAGDAEDNNISLVVEGGGTIEGEAAYVLDENGAQAYLEKYSATVWFLIGTRGVTVYDEGTQVQTQVLALNFAGTGVGSTWNPTEKRVDVTIPAVANTVAVEEEGTTVSSGILTLNFIGPTVTAALDGARVNVTVAPVLTQTELPIVGTDSDTDLTTFARKGARKFDLSNYPAAVGALTRQVRFKAVIENTIHSLGYNAEVRLFDVTHAVAVTGSTLDNTGAADRALPTEVEATLTVGSSSGDIRSDNVATVYEVQVRAVGTLTPPVDRVILSNARLEIRYV